MSLLLVSEYDRLRAIVFNGLTNDELLTEFDRDFLTSYHGKFTQYQRHAYVSGNQDEQFNRIEKYLKEELGSSYANVK